MDFIKCLLCTRHCVSLMDMDTETKTDKRTTQSLEVVNVKIEAIYTQGTTHRSTSLCFTQGGGPQKSLNFELKEEG